MINPFDSIMVELNEIKQMINQSRPQQQAKEVAEIVDSKEVCKRLNISEPTLIRWRKKKRIPFFMVGSAVRFNWTSVIKELEKNK